MPQFQHDPPPTNTVRPMRIVRTPSKGRLLAVITSPGLLGCPTHFWGGRTVPHEASGCEACEKGSPWRMHYYIGAVLGQTREHVIFEMTEQATGALRDEKERASTIRGAMIAAHRLGGKTNGRVILTVCEARPTGLTLPKAPDLEAQLCKLWDLHTAAASSMPVYNGIAGQSTADTLKIRRDEVRRALKQSSNGQ